jgi:hypothetical protein
VDEGRRPDGEQGCPEFDESWRILSHSIYKKEILGKIRVRSHEAEGAASLAVSNFKIPNNPHLIDY